MPSSDLDELAGQQPGGMGGGKLGGGRMGGMGMPLALGAGGGLLGGMLIGDMMGNDGGGCMVLTLLISCQVLLSFFTFRLPLAIATKFSFIPSFLIFLLLL